ncbi:MAG: hypothetical protein ACKPKO_49255, partial [Candidatus Fonsibacter sp.]
PRKQAPRPEQPRRNEDVDKIKEYMIDMIFYESASNTSEAAENAEKDRTRTIKGKYYKGMRQLFIGQYTVTLDFLEWYEVEEFFDKWHLKLLTIDTQALQLLGYDLSNYELMTEL